MLTLEGRIVSKIQMGDIVKLEETDEDELVIYDASNTAYRCSSVERAKIVDKITSLLN